MRRADGLAGATGNVRRSIQTLLVEDGKKEGWFSDSLSDQMRAMCAHFLGVRKEFGRFVAFSNPPGSRREEASP